MIANNGNNKNYFSYYSYKISKMRTRLTLILTIVIEGKLGVDNSGKQEKNYQKTTSKTENRENPSITAVKIMVRL